VVSVARAVFITSQLTITSVCLRYGFQVGRSRNASRVELCSNRRLWRCCRITWHSGGGVVAFHRRSRLLMFAHDTYSGTNGRLTPFVGVDSNAISLNLTGQQRSPCKLEVGMLLHLRIKIWVSRNDIANRTENLSSKLQYASSHAAKQRANEMCNCGRGRERGCKMAGGRNMDSKFRNSHITGKHPSSENGLTKANTLMWPCRKGEQRRVSQCSRHVYRLDLLLWQQQNVICVQSWSL